LLRTNQEVMVDWIRVLTSRGAAMFRRRSLDHDLDDELRAHIDLAIEEKIQCGLSPEQAHRAAMREFGNVTQTKESYRIDRGIGWFETLSQDLRFAVRTLWKSPGFTAVVVLTLAVGIGGNTAIFSIVNGVLLNPLPFPRPAELISLHESKPNFQEGSISYPNFLDWRNDNKTFASMALTRSWSFSMTGRGDAEQLNGQYLSAGFFGVLGIHPLLGREFSANEEQRGAAPAALISEGLWRKKFNASPGILGQDITLDGRNFSIVGVIPASFRQQFSNFRQKDVYVPIMQWDNPILMKRGGGLGFHGIGRLKDSTTLDQARADMDQVTRNLAMAFPDANHGIGATLKPLKEQMVGEARPFLLVLLVAVGFVLLIACLNVASLLLARSASRSREFAVRTALGASRGRVLRQLLTESLLLGTAAGALGLVAAMFGTRSVLKVLPAALPRAEEVGVDLRVLVFTLAVSLFTGILFGLAPAWKTSRANPQTALKEGGRTTTGSHHRALGTLVIVEMAVALVLLAGAGLMISSLMRLWNVDPGFNPHGVLDFGLSMPPAVNTASPDRIRAMLRELDATFASVPGVKAVSQTWGALPMGGEDDMVFWRDDQPKPADDQHMSWTLDYIVEPDYLRIMQIPLLRGRFFSPQDNEHSSLVAVVDDVFARKFFPEQDPIGKTIDVTNPIRKLQIVGVVGHVRQWGLDVDDAQPLRAQLYIPCMQMPDQFIASSPTGTNIVLRYEGDLAPVIEAVRRVSREMSSEQVIYGDQTMDSMIADSMASRRFAVILLGAFAGLALLLACVGIYAVMANLVSQRTQEVGIRMALGAQRNDVLLLILRNGARLVLVGVVVGLVGIVVLTRQMDKLLFNVSPTDPAVLISVGILLVVVAMIACVLPARRAASIDPVRALRNE
jgi:predicted permease